MKKTYITPSIRCIEIEETEILSGSVNNASSTIGNLGNDHYEDSYGLTTGNGSALSKDNFLDWLDDDF